MNFVAMNFHYVRYPLSYFLDKIEKSEANSIELWAAAPHLNIYDATMEQVSFLKKDIERRNLKLECVTPEQCVYPVNIASEDEVLRNSSINYFKKTIEIANFFEAPRVIVCAGSGYFSKTREEAWKQSEESLGILSEFAKERGITLLLEPLMITTSNVINSSKELKKMIDSINSSNLFAMLDTSQMSNYPETPNDYFKNLGDKLQYIHFVDRGHLVPGDGDLPMEEYYRQIKSNGYDGCMSFEICDRRYYCDPNKAQDDIEKWIETVTK